MPSGRCAFIERIADMAALPADALVVIDAATPGAVPLPPDEIQSLMVATARSVVTIRRNEPVLSARAGAAS